MLGIEYSKFAKQERQAMEARCEQIFKSITALENEFKVLESRMAAIDTMEELYSNTEQELERAHATISRLDRHMGEPVSGEAGLVEDLVQSVRPVRSRRRRIAVV